MAMKPTLLASGGAINISVIIGQANQAMGITGMFNTAVAYLISRRRGMFIDRLIFNRHIANNQSLIIRPFFTLICCRDFGSIEDENPLCT